MKNIGFIGTGIMGSRMAGNLLQAGFAVTVHNRTQTKAAELLAAGAHWAANPADLAQSDCVITMLAHPQAVEAAALAADTGFLDALRSGAVWMDCSTGNPAFARRMAHEARQRAVHFLDAPVAGSKNQAQDAGLLFLVGGDADILARCHPLLEAMGKGVNHVGEPGMGTALKLVLNHLLATSMLAFAEGLVLGESLGLPQEVLLNALVGSAVVPPYMAGKRTKIEAADFEAEFPLRWMRKDLQMVAETAYDTGAAMPVANSAKEIYQLAVRHGYGDDDFSAIYAFLKHMN